MTKGSSYSLNARDGESAAARTRSYCWGGNPEVTATFRGVGAVETDRRKTKVQSEAENTPWRMERCGKAGLSVYCRARARRDRKLGRQVVRELNRRSRGARLYPRGLTCPRSPRAAWEARKERVRRLVFDFDNSLHEWLSGSFRTTESEGDEELPLSAGDIPRAPVRLTA